jgi:hypothetical protein
MCACCEVIIFSLKGTDICFEYSSDNYIHKCTAADLLSACRGDAGGLVKSQCKEACLWKRASLCTKCSVTNYCSQKSGYCMMTTTRLFQNVGHANFFHFLKIKAFISALKGVLRFELGTSGFN